MPNNIIEMVTFKIKKDISETQFLEASHAFGEALQREIDGFIKRSLTKHCTQDTWVELIWWKSMLAAQAALETAPNTSEFKQYCAMLEEDGSAISYLEEKQ